jgi:hypothetical protein
MQHCSKSVVLFNHKSDLKMLPAANPAVRAKPSNVVVKEAQVVVDVIDAFVSSK